MKDNNNRLSSLNLISHYSSLKSQTFLTYYLEKTVPYLIWEHKTYSLEGLTESLIGSDSVMAGSGTPELD